MYVLKAIVERLSNGEFEFDMISIKAPTIDECFEELAKYKNSSYSYIKVDSVYLV